MSRASELEAARLAAERNDARCAALTLAAEPNVVGDVNVRGVLDAIATQLLAEATYISEQRKSGWKSRSDAHTAAGRILGQWAEDLAAYLKRDEPPMRPPLDTIKSPDKHAGLDPADGPISAQITSGLLAATGAMSPAVIERVVRDIGINEPAPVSVPDGPVTPDVARKLRELSEAPSLDAKLDIAFGKTQTHHTNGRIGVLPAVASCGSPDGFLSIRRESVTCPDCIAILDYQSEARASRTPTEPEMERDDPGVFDRLAGDTVTIPPPGTQVYVVTNLDQVPQFSEPGAVPARQTQQRMTFEAVREHGMARARGADHRSYSQVQAFSECGIRYALSDLDVTPAWWNVGGTALHYAVETVNREVLEPPWTEHAIETLWTNCLNRSVSETITEHPTVGPDQWRAAKKGAEGYDWWRVHGLDMVRRWIARLTWLYEQGWTIATFDGEPAIELDCPIWIYEGANSIKVENILDLVMVRGDTFLIVDFKSGASDPTSTYQLGQYGHALANRIDSDARVQSTMHILGAYWLARTDTFGPFDMPKLLDGADIRDVHPWSEIEYLITTMHRAESQGLYLPNKSKSDRFGCGSCGVSGLCPVGPR